MKVIKRSTIGKDKNKENAMAHIRKNYLKLRQTCTGKKINNCDHGILRDRVSVAFNLIVHQRWDLWKETQTYHHGQAQVADISTERRSQTTIGGHKSHTNSHCTTK